MLNEFLKICKKMISTDKKADAKQEIKEQLYLTTFHRSTFSKLEIQCKTSLYF